MKYFIIALLVLVYVFWSYKSIKEIRKDRFWTKRKPGGFVFWSNSTSGWYAFTIAALIILTAYLSAEYW